ncbi:MAG: cytochrome c peroxidase [Mariprofundaceae bacterium]
MSDVQDDRLKSKSDQADVALTPLAELGRLLMFDPRLSKSGSRACVSCHNPALAWSDGLPNAMGDRLALGRNTPSLLNLPREAYFWDGRISQVKAAIKQHILSPNVMNGGAPSYLQSIDGYAHRFAQQYGETRLSLEHISEAIAKYLETIAHKKTAFDHWIEGGTLGVEAQAGYVVFTGKGKCASCHKEPRFTDYKFYNIGLNSIDPGRFEVTNSAKDRNRFRTPSLRQVSRTAPYMHDGSLASLEEVVSFYDRGGDRRGTRNALQVLHLSEDEKTQLVTFLRTLTFEADDISIPRLPISGEKEYEHGQ